MNKWLKKIRTVFSRRKRQKNVIDLLDFNQNEDTPWWGTFTIQEEQSRYIKIGNLIFCIDHYDQEWRLNCHLEHDKTLIKSFGIQSNTTDFTLKPVLLDRPLLCVLEYPLFIPPNSEIVLYVSSPVVIQITASSLPMVLSEIQSVVPQETWFGNTLEGELCYAGSHPYLHTEELIRDPIHVISPITIVNQNKSLFVLKEIKLPLPHLSVYEDSTHHLWTEQLCITCKDNLISSTILKNNVSGFKNLGLLSPPREGHKPRFKGLFSSLRK